VTPLVLWCSYFGILRGVYGIGWERNIWLSAVLLAGLSGLLLNTLLVPAQANVAGARVHVRDVDDTDQAVAGYEERLAA
jgi:hypothetical protein